MMNRSELEEQWQQLQGSAWLQHVDRAAWSRVAERIEEVVLAAGEVLLRRGEPGDALYVLTEGRLRAFSTRDDGEEVPLAEIAAGGTVGEIQLLTGGERTATVQAVEESRLIGMSREVFDDLARAAPRMLEELVEVNRRRLDRSLLAEVLPGLFGPLDEAALALVESEAEWTSLESGESLFEQGDSGDRMYVLLRGRLAAVATDGSGGERTINEIERGECVGEMGLLTDQPRSVAVRALRDSRLVAFSKESFERVRTAYPQALVGVTRVLVGRLTKATGAPTTAPRRSGARTLALVPAAADVPMEEFVAGLLEALSAHGSTLRLSRERAERQLGEKTSFEATDSDPGLLRLAAWLDDQEHRFRFVLYEAEDRATGWTAKCLRQADQILLVTTAEAPPEVDRLNGLLDLEQRTDSRSRASLVVLHRQGDRRPRGTGDRKRALGIEQHMHVRLQEVRDMERLARLHAGRAIGLALGGGGARAFAHIGVIRAFEEAGLPIDMVGGTSVGSYMAAMYALGLTPEEMTEGSRQGFLEGKPHRDLTLPLFGFISGRRGDRIQRRLFGDIQIEDLWTNYFAISANLTTARQNVHVSGEVCHALRASLAVPGAIVPAVFGSDLAVDGGVLNNLPADVMRRFCGGRVVAVAVSPDKEMSVATEDGLPNPWRVFWSRINPLSRPIKAPFLIEILARSSTLASVQDERSARASADLYLKPPVDDFGIYQMSAIDRIIEIGYRYARKRLTDWES